MNSSQPRFNLNKRFGNYMNKFQTKFNNRFFNNNNYSNSARRFAQSNSIVAKFAFIILVLFLFIIILRFSGSLLSWFFSHARNPTLIEGTVNAKQMIVIPQNPSINGSRPIMRSVNENEGVEFSWSVWIFNDDFSYKREEYKHIFHKGNDNINISQKPYGKNFPNNGPGLYITPNTNDLLVVMNTFDQIAEEVTVQGIPMNKWVNIILRINKQKHLDVFINGTLAKRHRLQSIPKQNYGNVFVGMNGGYSGFISDLKYFNNAIGTTEINAIANKGPNTKMNSDDIKQKNHNYLSQKWFFN